MERSTAFVKGACLLLLAAGAVRALWIMVSGEYEIAEYGVHARLQGWNARIPALLELAFYAALVWATWRTKWFDEQM